MLPFPSPNQDALDHHFADTPTISLGSRQERHADPSSYIGNLLGAAPHMADVIPNASRLSCNLQTYKLNMSLNENTQSNRAMIYNVCSELAAKVSASSWRDAIDKHGKFVADHWSMGETEQADAWKHASYQHVCTESKMLEDFMDSQGDALYAMDNDGWLQCPQISVHLLTYLHLHSCRRSS